MTVARFERIIRDSGLEIEFARNYATKGIFAVAKTPVLRELFTSACTCVLKVP
jgi:hypothetical protein